MSEQAAACADAPIFRPSASEWADPYEYIRSVSVKANEYAAARPHNHRVPNARARAEM